jgi:hypothetical protein
MGALYDAAARALREPSSELQALAWERQNFFFEHREALEAKRLNGGGTDTIIAQRRERGAGYVHVRDWCELDGYTFRCNTAKPFAEVLLSLFAFKKLHCVQGSHEGLREMMGVFGKLCSPSTIRNAVAELAPLGLQVEPYFDHHPEGFRCRKDRRDADDAERRLREWAEASPLYSLAEGSRLARILVDVMRRSGDVDNPLELPGCISRLPTVSNLSGSSLSVSQREKHTDRASLPCGIVHISSCATDENSPRVTVRPSAEEESTARPLAAPEAAPEKAAKRVGGRRAPAPAHSHVRRSARLSVPRSQAPVSRRTPAPVDAPRPAPAPSAPATLAPELVRELVALALAEVRDGRADDRAARLAELDRLAEQQAADEFAARAAAAPLTRAAALPAPVERLTPREEQKRNLAVLPLLRAQRDARVQREMNPAASPRPLTPAEWRALEAAECRADAEKRSRNRVERPTRARYVTLGDSFTEALAALRPDVHNNGASAKRSAAHRAEADLRQQRLAPIVVAVEELQAAVARARLPASRVALIDRAVGNAVALYQRGELDAEAVLASIWSHRRSIAALAHSGDAAGALERVDAIARERALNEVKDDAIDDEEN